MLTNFKFGLIAEYIVIIYYFCRGYLVIKHRWRSRVGEIDLIFTRGKKIIFCEVKARRSEFNKEYFITYNQQKRLRKAAEYFLAIHPNYNKYMVSFDLVIVRPFKLPVIIKNWQL